MEVAVRGREELRVEEEGRGGCPKVATTREVAVFAVAVVAA